MADGLTEEAEAALRGERLPGPFRIFTHPLLEAWWRCPPWLPFLVYPPLLPHLVEGVALEEGTLAFAGGWLAWSLLEYLMHRFLFHFPARGRVGAAIMLMVHHHHHAAPKDPGRLVATLWQSGSVLLLLWGLGAALAPHLAGAALAGAITGYLAYEAVHYLAHHGAPQSRVLRAFARHHLRHHADRACPCSRCKRLARAATPSRLRVRARPAYRRRRDRPDEVRARPSRRRSLRREKRCRSLRTPVTRCRSVPSATRGHSRVPRGAPVRAGP